MQREIVILDQRNLSLKNKQGDENMVQHIISLSNNKIQGNRKASKIIYFAEERRDNFNNNLQYY